MTKKQLLKKVESLQKELSNTLNKIALLQAEIWNEPDEDIRQFAYYACNSGSGDHVQEAIRCLNDYSEQYLKVRRGMK